jgi:hypothetical protein
VGNLNAQIIAEPLIVFESSIESILDDLGIFLKGSWKVSIYLLACVSTSRDDGNTANLED